MSELNFFDFDFTPIKRNYNRNLQYNKENILVSIITIYYSNSTSIIELSSSLLNQTLPCFEWIIIKCGKMSKDDDDILEKIQNMDERFFVYKNQIDNVSEAKNIAFSESRASIIFCLPVNCVLDNTILECGYFSLYTNSNYDISYSNSVNLLEKELINLVYNKDIKFISNNFFIRKDKLLNKLGEKPSINMNFYGSWIIDKNNSEYEIFSINQSLRYPLENNIECFKYPYIFKDELKIYNNSNKKKILFLIPWTIFGGADLFNMNFVKYLKENGYEITIITTEVHDYELRQKFEYYVDEYFDLTTFLSRKDWPAFISHIIKTRNIDVVFQCNSMYGYVVIPWLKYIFPNIHIIDFLHAEQWEWRDGGYPRDSIAISKFLDKTFVCSKHLKNVMEKDMNKKTSNTEVIYLGIDTDKFNPALEQKNLDINLLNKINGKKVILFPCRLAYIKRPILALNILKRLVDKNKNLLLLVVGNGQALKAMKDFVNNNNISHFVEFIDYKEDVRPYYMVSDITLITSLSEGITLTTYESLSMGVPVVTSDVGGQKEVVDGTVGAVIKNYQSKEKDEFNFNYTDTEINQYVVEIERILNLSCEEKNSLKERCRNKVLNKFSSKIMYKKLKDSIESLNYDNYNYIEKYLNNSELFERYLVNFNEKDYLQRELDKIYLELVNLNSLICDKEKYINELSSIINQKSKEIDIKDKELVSIKSSRSYKLIEKIRKIVNKN